MASDLRGYSADEVLNKVLNTSTDSIKVDIVAGAEYAEDSQHTDLDTGQFVLGVRNDTLAALGGTDGDYVPFQMNASGALYVEIATGGSSDAVHVDDAAFTLGSHKGMMMMGFAGTQSVNANDAGAIAMETDGSVHIHDGGNTITVDGTVTANLSSTDNTVLDNILTKNTEIDAVLDTIDADTGAIKTAVEIIDNAISGSEMQVDVVAALPAGSNTIGVVDLGSTDNAVLDAIDAVLDTIKTDTGTIDSDTDAINTATVASQAALEKMLYGNALAVTAVHGGTTHALGATYEALYVGVGGNVVVTMVGTGNFTFSNVASGQLLPIRITHVINTNTTATNMIALKA